MPLKLYLLILLIIPWMSIYAQNKDYNLFKEVIDELYEEALLEKPVLERNFEESSGEIKKYDTAPKVSVIGGSKEENEALEKVVEEIISESPPTEKPSRPPRTTKKKETTEAISFTSIRMFPDEPEGFRLLSAEERQKQPKKEIKWVEGPTITTTHEIDISELPEKEQQELLAFSKHDTNISALNKINFIEALYKNSRDEGSIEKLIKDFDQSGHNISGIFKKMKILEENEKKSFLKSQFKDIINKIIY